MAVYFFINLILVKLVASASMLWNDRSLEIQPRFLFAVIQAALTLLLNDRSQLTQASNITSSSVVHISSTADHIKTTFVSFCATQTTSLTTTMVSSIVLNQSKTFTTKTTSSSSKASKIPRTTISVTQFNDAVTPTTAIHVVGLPDEKVIYAIAGILGAILVLLLGILFWYLCVPLHLLLRRPLSRIQPSGMPVAGSMASELV